MKLVLVNPATPGRSGLNTSPASLPGTDMFAENPELSFTWYDAAVLSQEIRKENAS